MEFQNWEQSFRYIVQQSKTLPPYPAELKTSAHEVSGCEAKVWLALHSDGNDRVQVRADSDSRIVRGLLAIIVQATDGKTATELRQFDGQALFVELGLLRFLSPSRTNGVLAVIAAIRREVR